MRNASFAPAVDRRERRADQVANRYLGPERRENLLNLFHAEHSYDKRMTYARGNPLSVLDAIAGLRQSPFMFGHDEIVRRLERQLNDHGATQAEVADLLGIAQPRVSEILAGKRLVKLDEAKKLADRYKWSDAERQPISEAIARLVVIHVAEELQADYDPSAVAELAQDVRAFSEFVADPSRRQNPDLVEGLFAGRRSHRREART